MRFVFRQIKRLAIGLLLVVGVFFLSVPVTLASMIARFRAMMRRGIPGGPQHPAPPEGERSMEDVMDRLRGIPFNPVSPRFLGLAKGALNNSYPSVLNALSAPSGRIYPYPREFEEVTLQSFDGAELAAVIGLHRDGRPRPGLVIGHGYMGSKNDHYVISTALRAFAGWGFNVLAIDFRDFGKSQRLGFNPTSFGWKEGEDLLAGARYLADRPGVTSVGITGFSMGAVSTMRAAYMAREYPYLTGGAIAWNGASDGQRVLTYLEHKPVFGDEFLPYYINFRLSHWLRREDMKRHATDPQVLGFLKAPFREYSFKSFLTNVSAAHYGVSFNELIRGASPKEYLADLEVPLLVIHSVDDPVCPASEMEELIEISKHNRNLEVWMMPTGMHCVYPYLDRDWFDTVMRRFFEYWASWE